MEDFRMRTIAISSELLVNKYPSSYLFKTKHIGGSLFKLQTKHCTNVSVLGVKTGLGFEDFYQFTITDNHYQEIEKYLNRISPNKIDKIR